MESEVEKRRWYMEEAERIIIEDREDELVQILTVRDSACALYATLTCQLTDGFPDSDVVKWLDEESIRLRAAFNFLQSADIGKPLEK